jgi:hypothetical protein
MRDYAFDILDALNAPVITFSWSWADSIPQRVKQIIPQARMVALMKKEEMATYPEVVAYMITRTFEAPMHGEWVDIYMHVSCTVCEQYFNEDHWDELHAPRELQQYDMSLLNQLRRFIYEKRRKSLKEKLKTEKNEQRIQQGLPEVRHVKGKREPGKMESSVQREDITGGSEGTHPGASQDAA